MTMIDRAERGSQPGEPAAARWARLLARYGVSEERAAAAFTEIAAAYAQPHRHYHTLDHILRAISVIDRLRSMAKDPDAVELAAWLHDLVYDPAAGDNEELSARDGGQLLLSLGVPSPVVERVQELVLATKWHEAHGDPDAAVLIDADLFGLADPWPMHQAFGQKIREEYSNLMPSAYRAGRQIFLRRFLNRDWIFQTGVMRDCCEAAARQNLQREYDSLK